MRVLFSFGNAQLRQTLAGNILRKRVLQRFWAEGHADVRHGGVVLRHADEIKREKSVFPLEALKIGIDECTGDLTRTVGAEVEEDDGVARLNRCVLGADGRENEFVRYAVFVGILHGLHRFGSLRSFTVNHCGVCFRHALPAVVAVHCVVTAHYGRYFADADFLHFCHAVGDIIAAGRRRNVASVEERMNVDLFAAALLCKLQERVQVRVVAVHAAVGKETHEVKGLAAFNGLVDRLDECGVLKEIPVFDRLCDARQFLVNDAARADVGVTDFGVAHLAVRQADAEAGCANLCERVFRENAVKVRFLGGLDCVAVIRADAEAVHDN